LPQSYTAMTKFTIRYLYHQQSVICLPVSFKNIMCSFTFFQKNSFLVLSKRTVWMNFDLHHEALTKMQWMPAQCNVIGSITNVYNTCKHQAVHRHMGRKWTQILSNCRTAFWIYFLIRWHFFWDIAKTFVYHINANDVLWSYQKHNCI